MRHDPAISRAAPRALAALTFRLRRPTLEDALRAVVVLGLFAAVAGMLLVPGRYLLALAWPA